MYDPLDYAKHYSACQGVLQSLTDNHADVKQTVMQDRVSKRRPQSQTTTTAYAGEAWERLRLKELGGLYQMNIEITGRDVAKTPPHKTSKQDRDPVSY